VPLGDLLALLVLPDQDINTYGYRHGHQHDQANQQLGVQTAAFKREQ
jgi:hypothetical protein